jgi:hypothetical protein
MKRTSRVALVLLVLSGGALPSAAQVSTGSITGAIKDPSGASLPGVNVTLTGEHLIGGAKSSPTDAAGAYRFERLPPGAYDLKFELSGFKTVERKGVRINAAFTATVDAALEVGRMEETVTVTGESPTVDTKSNLQQTVMSQELLEGVPTGRDPWSVAKLIPGVLSSTYDVGGTQGMQQSALSAHGSLDADKTFAIDGLAVNWPGGAGGSTMLYYDQGMFDEVNYQTAAIPAEVAAGGIFINMVTKSGSNRWKGDFRAFFANDSTQGDNSQTDELKRLGFTGGSPIERLYDLNLSGGGPLIKDRLWFNGAVRTWSVNRLTLGARNPDGTPATDDNRIRNYSGKLVYQLAPAHKLAASYNFDDKQRFHRRDPPPAFVEDRASLHQFNPAASGQIKYTYVRNQLVFDSGLGMMDGETEYQLQKEVQPGDLRREDSVRNSASVAGPRHQTNPNSRIQFDNTLSYRAGSPSLEHLLKAGVQFSRLRFLDEYEVNGDMYLLFNDGVPNSVRIWNTPVGNLSLERQIGLFAQDTFSLAPGLTLNIGGRYDMNKGWIPAQSSPAGTFVAARSIQRRDMLDQSIFAFRTGAVWDVANDGKTAIKASYSRYANMVGINRVQLVHPFAFTSGTRSWTDRNGDRLAQPDELGTFTGFADVANRYADADGPDWPYSDEITFGIERQLLRDVRAAAMYYHRTNRKQMGFRNATIPTSAYTAQTVAVPGAPTGPGGSVTFYNLSPAFFGASFVGNVYDNQDVLDTDYNGVELTLSKRFSGRWQMLAGLTFGTNRGGALTAADLNDPNVSQNFADGVVGPDSKYALRLAGSYLLPGNFNFAMSLVSNGGYPYQSTYNVTRTVFPALTRATQTVRLSERGDERLPNVTLLDLRLSRAFKIGGGRSINPQIDVFNVTNASTFLTINPAVGSVYRVPTEILAPRIVRFGLALVF